MLLESLGYIAAFLFAICGLPQAVHCRRVGHADDISALFLGLWGAGEVLMAVYTGLKLGVVGPLFLNYGLNLAAILYISSFKVAWKRFER